MGVLTIGIAGGSGSGKTTMRLVIVVFPEPEPPAMPMVRTPMLFSPPKHFLKVYMILTYFDRICNLTLQVSYIIIETIETKK